MGPRSRDVRLKCSETHDAGISVKKSETSR